MRNAKKKTNPFWKGKCNKTSKMYLFSNDKTLISNNYAY